MGRKYSLLKLKENMIFPFSNGLFFKRIKCMGIYITIFQNLCDERYKNTVQRHISRFK